MNIAVIGQGAIGLLWYHHLSQATNNLVSLHCSSSVTSVPKSYEFTDINQKYAKFSLNIADDNALTGADVILLCVKSYQVNAAIFALKNKISTKAIIIFCHNGLGAFNDFSALEQPCLALLTTHGCKINQPFHAQHTGLGHSDLGLINGNISNADRNNITSTFMHALPTLTYSDNIKEKQWLKLAINCVINPITALENIDNGQLINDKFQVKITALILEIIAIAAFENIEFNFDALREKIMAVAQSTAQNCSSMRSDILNKRKTEIDYINGYIVKVANRMNFSVPENEKLLREIKALEA